MLSRVFESMRGFFKSFLVKILVEFFFFPFVVVAAVFVIVVIRFLF
jgi:hypothetical protein